MERFDATRRPEVQPESTERAGMFARTKAAILTRMGGVRKAATVALAGGVAALAAADRATAGTINMDAPNLRAAQLVRGSDVTEQPARAVSLLNNDIILNAGNADGTSDEMLYWLGIQRNSPEYNLDAAIDLGSSVQVNIAAPNSIPEDGINSDFLLIQGDLNELQQYYLLLDADGQTSDDAGAQDFLANSTVFAGYGSLSGNPQNINEAIAMTDGYVYYGDYPASNIDINDAWILASYSTETPEPSTLALLAAGAGGIGLASRRRLQKTLNNQSK